MRKGEGEPRNEASVILSHKTSYFCAQLIVAIQSYYQQLINDSQAPDIVGYDILKPVEGNTVTFSCPPGLELNGSNSATCTGNEEWEPDPSWLTCNEPDSKGKKLYYMLQ